MKRIFIICVFLILIITQIIDSKKYYRANEFSVKSFNTKLLNFLENDLRYIMRNNEPILDPYMSYQQTFQYNDGTIIFKGKLSDFTVNNLSHYIVKYSNVNIFSKKVNINLLFPTIISNGFYNFDARYQDIPYSGNGYYNVTVGDFSFSAEAYVQIIFGIQIKSLYLKIALPTFDFSASNDYFDSEEESKEWSAKVSQFVPTFINNNHDSIVKLITPKLIDIINQQLQNNLFSISNSLF